MGPSGMLPSECRLPAGNMSAEMGSVEDTELEGGWRCGGGREAQPLPEPPLLPGGPSPLPPLLHLDSGDGRSGRVPARWLLPPVLGAPRPDSPAKMPALPKSPRAAAAARRRPRRRSPA